ncbi:hypothetical protein DFH07DRAFT_824300 [Mycena maculata]|uniref:BTB domain-containing protein n=1 Tax=Mycena maculata TaxID=230809 RepID=A0AAD7IYT5_9AGAR|nr:hypothetical protein DFH07DRAFT_824300 [Mycena maculata]
MEIDNEPTVKCQGLWFEDGNLIIHAGNTQFRVYRGVLAARSPVFQDMLSFPQPPDSELVEGCPVVRLHDNTHEVTDFLKAIFDSQFFEPYPAPTDIFVIAGVLRLSHKYGIDYLRRRAFVHLTSAFFTTLSAYDDSIEADDGIPWKLPSWAIPDSYVFPALVYVVQLAREVGGLWILPYAFYQLAEACPNKPDVLSCIKLDSFAGFPALLSEDDQSSFVKGYCVQISTATSDVLRFLRTPQIIPGCRTPHGCLLSRLEALDLTHSDLDTAAFKADPLLLWYGRDWDRLADACDTCVASLKAASQATRQAFWDQLPQMYGLPPWEELEKIKAEALGQT